MGNMGDMSLMSVVEEYSRHRLTEVRENVPKAMRRYDVDQVKDFTVQWLARETSPDVKRELFDTIYHQYLDANKPVPIEIVEQAIAHLQQQPQLLTRQSIFRILTPWVAESKRVRDVLKAQAKIEFKAKSGLYSLAAEALPREDVEEVLADMPQLARQFGKATPTAPTPNGMPVGFDLGETNTPGVTP